MTSVTPGGSATSVTTTTSITATFSEAMNPASVTGSTIELRDPSNTPVPGVVTYDGPTRRATLQPSAALAYSTTYSVRIVGGVAGVQDAAGNPLAADVTSSFSTAAPPPLTVRDTTVGDFGAGVGDAGIYVSHDADGELVLKPAVGIEFEDATLPTGWSSAGWNAGATPVVAAGKVALDGALLGSDPLYTPGQSIEFSATFSTDTWEHAGFAVTLGENTPWAIFSTASGGGLYARSNDGIVPTDTLIPGSWLGTPHRYRIDWTSSAVTFFIDGTQVANHAKAIAANMRPVFSDLNVGGGTLNVDWVRLAPYASTGTFTSRVLDAGSEIVWSLAEWTAQVPTERAWR